MNQELYEQLKSFFSEEGFTSGHINVKIKGDLTSKISDKGDHIDIRFTESKPEMSIRIIDAKIDGITLGKKGGKVDLDSREYQTSIPFLYEWLK